MTEMHDKAREHGTAATAADISQTVILTAAAVGLAALLSLAGCAGGNAHMEADGLHTCTTSCIKGHCIETDCVSYPVPKPDKGGK